MPRQWNRLVRLLLVNNMNISNFVQQQLEESLKIQRQEVGEKISIFEAAVAQEGFSCSGADIFLSKDGHVRMQIPFLTQVPGVRPAIEILVVNKELENPTIHVVNKWVVNEVFTRGHVHRELADAIVVGNDSLQKAIVELLERHAERELLNGN